MLSCQSASFLLHFGRAAQSVRRSLDSTLLQLTKKCREELYFLGSTIQHSSAFHRTTHTAGKGKATRTDQTKTVGLSVTGWPRRRQGVRGAVIEVQPQALSSLSDCTQPHSTLYAHLPWTTILSEVSRQQQHTTINNTASVSTAF